MSVIFNLFNAVHLKKNFKRRLKSLRCVSEFISAGSQEEERGSSNNNQRELAIPPSLGRGSEGHKRLIVSGRIFHQLLS